MATLSPSLSLEEQDALRHILPLAAVPKRDLDRLSAISDSVSLGRKQSLQNSLNDDRLVLISRGFAKLEVRPPNSNCSCDAAKNDERGIRQVLSFHFPGDLVPVLRRPDTHATLVALTSLNCLVFRTDDLLTIADAHPPMMHLLLSHAFRAVDSGRSGMIQLASATATERLAGFLQTMAERIIGQLEPPCEFDLPMSRREIADHLGLTIETVSRQFAALRDLGMLETYGRSRVRLLSA